MARSSGRRRHDTQRVTGVHTNLTSLYYLMKGMIVVDHLKLVFVELPLQNIMNYFDHHH